MLVDVSDGDDTFEQMFAEATEFADSVKPGRHTFVDGTSPCVVGDDTVFFASPLQTNLKNQRRSTFVRNADKDWSNLELALPLPVSTTKVSKTLPKGRAARQLVVFHPNSQAHRSCFKCHLASSIET